MDVLSFAVIWIPIAVALLLLLKAQAKHLSTMRLELDASREALNSSGVNILALAARLDDIEGLKVGVLSQLSHELRTPVLAIREAATVITRYGQSKPETACTFGEKITREADRLSGMIENLLSVVQTNGTSGNSVGICTADPNVRQRCKGRASAACAASSGS